MYPRQRPSSRNSAGDVAIPPNILHGKFQKHPCALRKPSISYRDGIRSKRRASETVSRPERTPSSASPSKAARDNSAKSVAIRRPRSSGISRITCMAPPPHHYSSSQYFRNNRVSALRTSPVCTRQAVPIPILSLPLLGRPRQSGLLHDRTTRNASGSTCKSTPPSL